MEKLIPFFVKLAAGFSVEGLLKAAIGVFSESFTFTSFRQRAVCVFFHPSNLLNAFLCS